MKVARALMVAAAAVFPRFPDDARKVAAAQRLFGRAGLAMLPHLNRGVEGLGAAREAAHAHGVAIREL